MQYSLSKPVSDERNRKLPLQVVSLSAHAQIPLWKKLKNGLSKFQHIRATAILTG